MAPGAKRGEVTTGSAVAPASAETNRRRSMVANMPPKHAPRERPTHLAGRAVCPYHGAVRFRRWPDAVATPAVRSADWAPGPASGSAAE